VGPAGALGAIAFGISLIVSVRRFDSGVRGKVLVLAVPTVAAAILVSSTFGGYLSSSTRFTAPIPLFWMQWVALLLVPLAVFGVAVELIRRGAQMRADARLGRAVRAAGEHTRCVPPPDVPRSLGGSAAE
jgi:hypothetical protein